MFREVLCILSSLAFSLAAVDFLQHYIGPFLALVTLLLVIALIFDPSYKLGEKIDNYFAAKTKEQHK